MSVDLFFFDLDAGEPPASCLSADERQRAATFHFERDRQRWVAARGWLRFLLGHHLGLPPEELVFGLEAQGKPFLAHPTRAVDFNLSHTGAGALVAISRAGAVGVDLEPYARGADLEECQTEFCSVAERARVAALGDRAGQLRELVGIWCAKESYLKALGVGLVERLQDLTTFGRQGDLVLEGAIPRSHRVHFPKAPSDYCAAVALPLGCSCPEIRWFSEGVPQRNC